ncbi:ImmA/IrrE family metallo-endopeptidase [Roseiarcaceae bacterium H3SJ34-1]|uniref:ImmA/IrrE family metallo-endopeptidase n=1 Tax=Terripilifer ovatus TaxID=3032367 RepID=UPI003AB94A44|nr:ImmA/IrrE family metallo-endopeptidase [Roseiarcaceae bacterium H3SJ34-1]
MSFEPDWASSPGATISRLMTLRDIASDELAFGLGMEAQDLNALIGGNIRITREVAEALANCLGSSPRFWMARDRTYLLEAERLRRSSVKDIEAWSKALPLKSMREFGWLSDVKGEHRYNELLSFFGCKTLSEWGQRYSAGVGAVAFRTSFAFEADAMATLVWLRIAERQVEKQKLNRYDEQAFEALLPHLKRISVFKQPKTFVPRLQAACHSVGVALTTARAPRGCRASGASWVSKTGNPVIHLSFRHRSDDHFWFTFFHEAGHVLLHRENHIDVDGSDPALFGSTTNREAEADAFAQEALVPSDIRKDILNGRVAPSKVIAAAKASGVTAGIIVGQLEKTGALPHGKMGFLKRRYRWEDDPYLPVLG